MRTDKRLLVRFTWHGGQALADGGRPAAGRGVYACRRAACLEMFYRRPERWPRWFKAAPQNGQGKEGAGMKGQQDATERRDGSAA